MDTEHAWPKPCPLPDNPLARPGGFLQRSLPFLPSGGRFLDIPIMSLCLGKVLAFTSRRLHIRFLPVRASAHARSFVSVVHLCGAAGCISGAVTTPAAHSQNYLFGAAHFRSVVRVS